MKNTMVHLLFLCVFSGCSEAETKSETEDATCGQESSKRVAVISSLGFARRDNSGQTVGFNLDGVESEIGNADGCGIPDQTSLEGEPGIDSAFSGLLPALEATQAVAVNGLIEDSIKNGELILLLEISRLDDWENDECADFSILRGEGAPMIGTDGELLDAQSFKRSDLPTGNVDGIQINDGVFTAQSFDYMLPVQVLDVFVEFSMKNTRLWGQNHPDGSISGYFGGSVPLEDFNTLTELTDIGEVSSLLENLLGAAADMDLDADGQCDAISLVFEFESIVAYFYSE